MIQKSRRTFSKRLVIINGVLTWSAVFSAIYFQATEVGVAALGLLATIITAYMGVGHMDYRSVLNKLKGQDDSGSPSQSA